MPAPNISVRKEGKWATTAVDKAYQDALALVTRNSRVAYANFTYTGGVVQVGGVADAITELGSLADASNTSIAELKAQWWQNEIPNYLQWSVDIGGIETTYTNSTTANILLRTTGVKNAGITYASTVGTAIKAYETTTATARELYLSTLMTISETAAEAAMRADRDKEIALANADLQKQLTGNESAHTTAVNNANSAHNTATANAEAARKSAKQAALTQLNSTVAQAAKDKEASIAGAERTYDQTVASLDAQYGSESFNGDTGDEGATRRSAIATRDAQYYAARDTSWANTLSGSTILGTSPWTVKAITAANAQAAHSVSRANAQAAHDAAMLDAIEDWQLSNRESLTDLLFTEGQSRETFNVATSNVYANWGNGVGNLLGDKPEGTGWGINEVRKTDGNREGTGLALGSGDMPARGWETNGENQQGGQKEKSGQVNEVPEELPIPKRENPYYQVWKNTDDLDNEIAARRMGMIMQPNRRRFFEEEIAQLGEARNVIVGPRQSVLFESYKDWNKNSLNNYVAALNGDIQTDTLDSVMYRTGQASRTVGVVAGSSAVIVTSGGTMSPILYGGLVAYEVDQAQAGVRSIWLGEHVDTWGGTAFGNYAGHDTTEGKALKIGYELGGLAGLARAPWRLTNAGEIVADSSALGKVLDDAPIHSDDLITVYRGMGKAQFDALSNGSGLMSNAQLAGGGAKPGLYQKYIWHSLNSSNPMSPYVSVTQSPGVARHFIIDGMPTGFRGALKDLAIRVGWSKPLIADGKILAEITMRRSDLSRTLHLAQDELVADGGTKIFSIRAVANPELQSRYSWRVYASSVGLKYSLYELAVEDE